MLNWRISANDAPLVGTAVATLVFPLAASFWLRHVAKHCATSQERTDWVGYTRRVSPLMILAVPIWWSLSVVIRDSNNLGFVVPLWALIVVPLSTSILIFRLVLCRSDAYVFGKRWTGLNIFRLAWWRTVSSTFALLIAAVGLEEIHNRNFLGFAWMLSAAIAAFFGKIRLREAEGLKPRRVKSGELYKRSIVLAKKMGVRVEEVCVVPFGRGHLTNAYGGLRRIAVTDDYGHWLHGSQLDFVIGHELAHVKQKDALKSLAITAGMFIAVSAAIWIMPQVPMVWRIVLNFVAVLAPVMVFYAQSRHREYMADRLSVEANGEPEAAISALAGLYRRTEVPVKLGWFAELFSTHPGLWSRINAIADRGGVPSERLSEFRESLIAARTEPISHT